MKFKTLKNLARIGGSKDGMGMAIVPTAKGAKVISCSRHAFVEEPFDYPGCPEPVYLSNLDAAGIKSMSAKDGEVYFLQVEGKKTMVVEEKFNRIETVITGCLGEFPNVERLKEIYTEGEPVVTINFSLELLQELLSVLEKAKCKSIQMEIRHPEKAVVIKDIQEDGIFSMLMPMKK